jgi:hypothetical protein
VAQGGDSPRITDGGAGQGGAIYNGAQLHVANSTLTQCEAVGGQGYPYQTAPPGRSGNAYGGAVCNRGSMTLTHLTIASNSVTSPVTASGAGLAQGGGIHGATNSCVLRNALLAGGGAGSNWFGTALVDEGNNLSSDASCPFTAPGSFSNTDPLLGPLADNGGPTPTMALLPGSPAMDAGNPAFCSATDQRGAARPQGTACDIGAFEAAADGRPTVITSLASDVTATAATLQGTVVPEGAATTVVFEWGTTTAYGHTTPPQAIGAGASPITISVSLTGLVVATTYHFRCVASNAAGVAWGGDRVFTTRGQADLVRFGAASYEASETAGRVTISVTRTPGQGAGASVWFSVANGSALAGADFLQTNGMLNFGAGETNKSFEVVILDDALMEENETVNLTLSNPGGGASLGSPSSAVLTIRDNDDARVGFILGDNTVSETNGAVEILLFRWGASAAASSVDYTTVPGTATPGSDYVATDGVVTFAPGQMYARFVLVILPDNEVEPIESLQLVLSNPVGASLEGPSTRTLYIRDHTCNDGELQARVAAGGTITFSNDALIRVCSPLVVTQAVTIDAGGHHVTFTGGGENRLFEVAPSGQLHLIGLTLKNGLAVGADGPVTSGNPAGAVRGGDGLGGAVLVQDGLLMATACRFVGNGAVGGLGGKDYMFPGVSNRWSGGEGGLGSGGAISLGGAPGALRLTNCHFEANWARGGSGNRGQSALGDFWAKAGAGWGGAIGVSSTLVVNPPAVSLLGCTLVSNWTEPGIHGWGTWSPPAGGALATRSATVSLEGCFLGWNRASQGSAVLLASGSVSLTNCTVVGHTNEYAIRSWQTATGFVANCTLAGNRGGAAMGDSGSQLRLVNTIVSGDSLPLCSGIVDDGYNLCSTNSCAFTNPTSRLNLDPRLAPPDDFGGPTPTMALLAGSPAIDAGWPVWCPATDQRGVARPYGAACDIGAFESAPPYSIRGFLTGYLASPGGCAVTILPWSSPADPVTGRYLLWDLPAGNHLVTPRASQAVFEPQDRLLSVTADVVNLNFHAWRSNAISISREGGGVFRNVLAGAAGDTWTVQFSTNLPTWQPVSAFLVPPHGLIEFRLTNYPAMPPIFFRGEKP